MSLFFVMSGVGRCFPGTGQNGSRLNVRVTVLVMISVAMGVLSTQSFGAAAAPETSHLESLRWERRVIVVFAAAVARESALETLASHEAPLEERDVTWVVIQEGTAAVFWPASDADERLAKALVDRFQPLSEPLDVVLIGKDGGVKTRTTTLDLDALFDQIDGMPMRRREMREQRPGASEAGR